MCLVQAVSDRMHATVLLLHNKALCLVVAIVSADVESHDATYSCDPTETACERTPGQLLLPIVVLS